MHRPTLTALIALAFVPAAAGQILIRDGDAVPGVGNVTSISDLAVNDAGEWIVEVDTDFAATTADGAVIKNGALLLREDQALAAPAGATANEFGALSLNGAGHGTWDISLSNAASTDAVYFDTSLVLATGTISTAAGFSPGTPYTSFYAARINAAGDALVIATVDDAAIPTTSDRAVVVWDLDPSGTLVGETVIAKEGDTPASLGGDQINDFSVVAGSYGFSAAGHVTYACVCSSSAGGGQALFLDTTLVARVGDPSPVPGRNWQQVSGKRAAVNASGALLYRGDLDGDTATDEVLVLRDPGGSSTVIVRQGDSIATPDGTFQIETIGSIALSDTGLVLYEARWSDPDSSRDAGLVIGGAIAVQEGKTTVFGELVTRVTGLVSLSPDGSRLLFEADLSGGTEAVVLIDTASVLTAFCNAADGALATCPCANPGAPDTGCDNAQATGGVSLALVAQTTSPNGATLQGTGFSTMGAPTAIVIRSNALDPSSPVIFGDGLRCVSASPLVRLAATTAVSGTSVHAVNHGAMAGPGDFYYQVWYRNTPSTYCDPFAAFNLSSGLRLGW
jgi:hypothetical protein